jgi:hypothetical protein
MQADDRFEVPVRRTAMSFVPPLTPRRHLLIGVFEILILFQYE